MKNINLFLFTIKFSLHFNNTNANNMMALNLQQCDKLEHDITIKCLC